MAGYETEAAQLETLALKLRYSKPEDCHELLNEAGTALLRAARKLRRPHGGDTELMTAIADFLLSIEPAKATAQHRRWWVKDYSRFDKVADAFHRMYGTVTEIVAK